MKNKKEICPACKGSNIGADGKARWCNYCGVSWNKGDKEYLTTKNGGMVYKPIKGV